MLQARRGAWPNSIVLANVLVWQFVLGDVGETTKMFLDDMSLHFDESTTYPDFLYEELSNCMAKWGVEQLEETQDAAFQKFYDYYLSGGSRGDAWGGREEDFLESKLNKSALFGTTYRTYEVQEPCNYVSNVGFYRSAIRVCDYKTWNIPVSDQIALMQTFITTGTSSCWFHGSMTNAGQQFDAHMVAILINNAYQILIRGTGTNSTILWTVGQDIEPIPFPELVTDITYMPLNYGVPEWIPFLLELQMQRSINLIIVALLAFGCYAFLPSSICDCLVQDVIAPELLNEVETDFFVNQYIPELNMLIETQDFPLPLLQGGPLFIKLMGVAIAFIWAFVFQKEQLPVPCLEGDFFNLTALGAIKSPLVDFLASLLHGVHNTDDRGFFDPRRGHPYPGSEFCNKQSPHALYHERAADAVFELYAVADEVEQLFIQRSNHRRKL
ncbi:expressed unknown protein [Seminavis robusta]|uniref:Uncharacterized protein n=1 Tax=Seminavis robusta TaxID=568900 RepID=A0A9N8HGX9_9STRA|nr:expressed unknown protein [Seminavis robusta]|eukprot:Sro603_g173880.1 n/a (441) ;mRNA; r:10606-11928